MEIKINLNEKTIKSFNKNAVFEIPQKEDVIRICRTTYVVIGREFVWEKKAEKTYKYVILKVIKK